MSFLFPQFLFGLFAISIPILIHLFNFQKPKKVFFTNVRFLKTVKETTSNNLKLKHILILICRILFIAFLVFAFAQPFQNGKNAALISSKPDVYFYVDNSNSLQNEIDGEKSLNVGLKSIESITEVYSKNTFYTILTNDFESKDQYQLNKEKLSERISEITYSNIFRNGNVIQRRLNHTASKNTSKKNHFFWLTDFQKSTVGDISTIAFDSNSQHYLFPLLSEKPSNIFIDSVWISNPRIRENELNNIFGIITNTGEKNFNNLIVKLTIDNFQVGTVNVNIPAQGSFKFQMNFIVNTGGSKKCKLTFEDAPVTFDNEYNFVINVSPKLKILHLYQKSGDNVKFVYSNEKIFDTHSNNSGDFDYSLIPVSDLIVLENTDDISLSLSKSLKGFVSNGGSLMVFPSANFDLTSYNNLFKSLNVPSVQKNKIDTSLGKINFTLEPPDFKNPFFRDIFEKDDKTIDMPFAYPVMQWLNRGKGILKYKNGDGFISVFSSGKGKVYMVASSLLNNVSNFARHGTFLPVMYKIAFESASYTDKLSYNFQEPDIKIPIDVKDANTIFTLNSENFKIIPEQRINGRDLIFSLPESNLKPGFYNIMQQNKVIKTLAFNLSKKESIVESNNIDEIKKYIAGKKNIHLYEASGTNFIEEFKSENVGLTLWKYCLILSLLFLLLEILLIRFYK